jgi:hypothetical protein
VRALADAYAQRTQGVRPRLSNRNTSSARIFRASYASRDEVFVAASSPPAAARLRLARRARRYDLNDDLGGGGSRPFAETPAAPLFVSAPTSFAVSVFTGGNGLRNNRAIRLCCAASSADRSPAAGSTVPLTRSIRDPRPRPRPARHPVSARDGPGAPSTEGSRGRRKEAIATGDPTNSNKKGTARFSSRSAHGEPPQGGAATCARDPRSPRRADRSRRAKCATRVRRRNRRRDRGRSSHKASNAA